MSSIGLLRKLRNQIYRATSTVRDVHIDGIKITVDPVRVPQAIAKALDRGDYELPERNAVKRILRNGDKVLEMGGGIGVVSITAARIAGPNRVFVFEPQASACELIRQNARINDVEIHCMRAAVGAFDGARSFFQSGNIISSSFLESGKSRKHKVDEVFVDVVSLKDALASVVPNVIICDIEGSETEFFSDFDFVGIDVLIIEMHPQIVGSNAIDGLVASVVAHGLAEVEELRQADTFVFCRDRPMSG